MKNIKVQEIGTEKLLVSFDLKQVEGAKRLVYTSNNTCLSINNDSFEAICQKDDEIVVVTIIDDKYELRLVIDTLRSSSQEKINIFSICVSKEHSGEQFIDAAKDVYKKHMEAIVAEGYVEKYNK